MSRMDRAQSKQLVLALHPVSLGVTFALFEGPLSPIDWGLKDTRGKRRNARALEAAKKLIDNLRPDTLVFEECIGPHSRRAQRVKRLLRLITTYAVGQGIEVHSYARTSIRECFKAHGAVTRYEIAQVIAGLITAFGHKLPPLRKAWMAEDTRMWLFDAASVAMTYYCQTRPTDFKLEPATQR